MEFLFRQLSQHLSQHLFVLSQHLVSQHLFWCISTCRNLSLNAKKCLNFKPTPLCARTPAGRAGRWGGPGPGERYTREALRTTATRCSPAIPPAVIENALRGKGGARAVRGRFAGGARSPFFDLRASTRARPPLEPLHLQLVPARTSDGADHAAVKRHALNVLRSAAARRRTTESRAGPRAAVQNVSRVRCGRREPPRPPDIV